MAAMLGAAMGGFGLGNGMPGFSLPKGRTPNKYLGHKKFGGAKEVARRRAKWLKANGITE